MRAPWLTAWFAFVVLAWAASPAHFWLDSGEIGAAGFELGVAHPPGAPGLLFLLRLSTLLPIGSLGFRMAIMCSALAAVAVGLTVAILQRRGAGPWLASICGLWVLVGLTFVRNGRVVEIYSLAAALLMVTLWGLDPAVSVARQTGHRLLAVAAAVWGTWCFGDLRLALVPLVVIAWVVAWRRRAAWSRWAPVVVAMASLVIVALPLASVGEPQTDWGNPETVTAWIDQLAARSIRESYAAEILPASASMWWLNAAGVIERLAEDLGAPGLVVAVICLVLLLVRRDRGEPPRGRVEVIAVVWLVVIELLFAIGVNPMGGADRQTGLVLAPLAAVVVGEVTGRWLKDKTRLRWGVLPLIAVVLIVPPWLGSASDRVVTRSWAPHEWTRAALAQLPPGTLLLTQSDDLAAGSLSARLLEGARPDVISIPAQHFYRPTPDAAAEDPRALAIWNAAHEGETEAERIDRAIAAHRGPVALELAGTGLFAHLAPQGGGRVPLSIRGSDSVLAAVPASVTPPQEVEAWLDRLPAGEDRRRLGLALSALARAAVQHYGAVEFGAATLALSVGQVYERQPGALVSLGALYDRMGDRAQAIALTRRALEVEPGRAVALMNLARYLVGDPRTADEALGFAEEAVRLRPWRGDGWVRLAEVRETRAKPDPG